jgi:hypothetical protein
MLILSMGKIFVAVTGMVGSASFAAKRQQAAQARPGELISAIRSGDEIFPANRRSFSRLRKLRNQGRNRFLLENLRVQTT